MADKLSRRDFIKLGGLGMAAVGGLLLRKTIGQEPIRSVIWGPDYDNIPYAVPPEFEGVKIPEINEHQLPASQIVMNGLKIYEGWCSQDDTLKPITYTPPDNYLDVLKVGERAVTRLATRVVDPKSLVSLRRTVIDAVFIDRDKHYSNLLQFGTSSIESLEGLLQSDIGSGIIAKTRQEFEKIFGKEKDILAYDLSFTSKERDFVLQSITSQLTDAQLWVDQDRHGNRISSGVLLPYFLVHNEGKLLLSLVDVTLYLKLLARNDLVTLGYHATKSGALTIGDQFVDEFSSAIPYHWLIDHTKELSDTNHLWNGAASGEFVDFMPIGRDGEYYHVWNIILWAACMSPSLVSTFVNAYYAPRQELEGSVSSALWHGKIKVEADVRTASEAPDLDKIYRKYITNK